MSQAPRPTVPKRRVTASTTQCRCCRLRRSESSPLASSLAVWASQAATASAIPCSDVAETVSTSGRPAPAGRASVSAPCTSAAARRASAPMSALVTSTRSGSSITPAFMNCRLSPEPGWMHRASVSATCATSASDWPMPTDSTITRSITARIRTTAAMAWSERPPSRSRAAIERTKTPESSGSVESRVRSPSSAPPVICEDGSTAMTPTVSPRAR